MKERSLLYQTLKLDWSPECGLLVVEAFPYRVRRTYPGFVQPESILVMDDESPARCALGTNTAPFHRYLFACQCVGNGFTAWMANLDGCKNSRPDRIHWAGSSSAASLNACATAVFIAGRLPGLCLYRGGCGDQATDARALVPGPSEPRSGPHRSCKADQFHPYKNTVDPGCWRGFAPIGSPRHLSGFHAARSHWRVPGTQNRSARRGG